MTQTWAGSKRAAGHEITASVGLLVSVAYRGRMYRLIQGLLFVDFHRSARCRCANSCCQANFAPGDSVPSGALREPAADRHLAASTAEDRNAGSSGDVRGETPTAECFEPSSAL